MTPPVILIVLALVLACVSYVWPTLAPAVILLCVAELLKGTGHI